VYVGKNRMDYLIEVASEDTVRDLTPDWSSLREITTRGIIVTSVARTKEYDFISRAFFPSIGINEDPVTGSAHCCLAPFWEKKLHVCLNV
jgi:predicted PhzF superfamily epimerase YddE/YHI9